jgi:hypothetical protein
MLFLIAARDRVKEFMKEQSQYCIIKIFAHLVREK